MMAGKKIALLVAALVLAGGSMVSAALTDGVRDMLVNHRYVATYKENIRNLTDNVPQQNGFDMWEHMKLTVGEDGQKKLLIELHDNSSLSPYDPMQLSYAVADGQAIDVVQYAGKPGKLKLEKTSKGMKAQYVDIARQNMDSLLGPDFGFLYYFLPLLPDQNKIPIENGDSIHYSYHNLCTLYNGSGTQTVGGKEYQYEEYVPDPAIWGEYLPKASIRYYFDQQDLKLVIYAYTVEQDGKIYSDYRSLSLDRFTSTFDDSLFTLPTDKQMSESDVRGMNMVP